MGNIIFYGIMTVIELESNNCRPKVLPFLTLYFLVTNTMKGPESELVAPSI